MYNVSASQSTAKSPCTVFFKRNPRNSLVSSLILVASAVLSNTTEVLVEVIHFRSHAVAFLSVQTLRVASATVIVPRVVVVVVVDGRLAVVLAVVDGRVVEALVVVVGRYVEALVVVVGR